MRVHVKLFAGVRQAAGCGELAVEVPDGASIGDVRAALERQVPSAQRLVARAMFASGREYATDQTPVDPTVELACIPPVSGG